MSNFNQQSQPSKVTPDSNSVQSYLNILQGVIARMANNSSNCKTWCISLVSAILVVIADKNKPNYAWITLIPIVLFFLLDSYYLGQERSFREIYNNFIQDLHSGEVGTDKLFIRRLLMCWIDYQSNQNDWRNVYKFYDKPSSGKNASRMLNLTLTEKVNKEEDLKTWLRSQQSAVIAEVNSNLVEDEQIEGTIEMIWKDSKDGEPKALLQAIYKLCKVSWINDESKWQNF